MPLFLTEEEFQQCSNDASLVAERADAFILDLRRQLETVRAEADAAAIAAEQTCTLIEQKYSALSSDVLRVQADNAQLSTSAESRLSELAEAQAKHHQLHFKAIEKDGEIERLNTELSEIKKTKRQLLEFMEQKDVEIGEKNVTIKSYLDKIVELTESSSSREAVLHEKQAELTRCAGNYDRLSQEKDLISNHNVWLNEELTTKANSLIELRKTHMDVEADMSAKIADLERQFNESSNMSKRHKKRVKELEQRVTSLEQDLCASKDATAASEDGFIAEISTANKLAELYKASSDEWSKKSVELEGVVKALETHWSQVENDYKERIEKESSSRQEFEKETTSLRDKLDKCEAELESARKSCDLSLLPIVSFDVDMNVKDAGQMIVPKISEGISGTALAASLLRDGWSLVKMYEKYHETADALRHEKWGRKNSETILERVFHEIEERAQLLMEERAEHERMLEAYASMNQKLQQAISDHESFDISIRQLKSEVKRKERDLLSAEREISDLQKQVSFLLKECQDIQFRCGCLSQAYPDSNAITNSDSIDVGPEESILERLLTFKDINELVEQNAKFRSLVRSLTNQEDKRENDLRIGFQLELQKVTDEAAAKVEAVLKRSEEQGSMIESLHSSVSMYKRLYEEERNGRTLGHPQVETLPEDGKRELMLLFKGSQEVTKKAHEQLLGRVRELEDQLTKMRTELSSLQLERDKMNLEANFAREKLDDQLKEMAIQRQEANGVSARNFELTHLLVEHQKRLREGSDSLSSAEENSRKLSMEISILKHEKELLSSSEKRASEEICSLSERLRRIQASLDTVHSVEEGRENERSKERMRLEQHCQHLERNWAEALKELQAERDRYRVLEHEKESTLDNSMRRVAETSKELADSLRVAASAEGRAMAAEARCSELEAKISFNELKLASRNTGGNALSAESIFEELSKAKDDLDKMKEEARANKDYMLQYKEIALANEAALKQIENAHEEYKAKAEKMKMALQDEILSLRNRASELEISYVSKSVEFTKAIEDKDQEISSAWMKSAGLTEELSGKLSQIESLQTRMSSLSGELEEEHKRRRTAQDNFERQVILQSEAIQELTSTSEKLSVVQSEFSKFRKLSEAYKTEMEMLKASWEKEKLMLQELKDEAVNKFKEINEQNRFLHDRLESLHIKLADKEKNISGLSSLSADSQADNDIQNVISYLRRSKEIAETEIMLLKQEKLRLQSQLENSMKAAETAQTLVQSHRENSRGNILKDEEFKSLKLEVKEINLLRESNMQLREENKHNFEESQKFREESRVLTAEVELSRDLLRKKDLEIASVTNDVEMHINEKMHLEERIVELLENCKNINASDHERINDELQQVKMLLEQSGIQLELERNIVSEKKEIISNLEHELAKCRLELTEEGKKINEAQQADMVTKEENEKQRKILNSLKRKNESLMKEKKSMMNEKENLIKEKEEINKEKPRMEEALKEKDARLHILEKTIEREREEFKREKAKRHKSEKIILEQFKNVTEKREKFIEEISRHKAIQSVLESTGVSAPTALDESASDYLKSVVTLEESTKALTEGLPIQASADAFLVDASNDTTGSGAQAFTLQSRPEGSDERNKKSIAQASAQQMRREWTSEREKKLTTQVPTLPMRQEGTGDKDKKSALLRVTNEGRRVGRRLIRPRLERAEEPATDSEITVAEGTSAEDARVASQGTENQGDVLLTGRKRLAPLAAAEPSVVAVPQVQDESAQSSEPPSKKAKDSDLLVAVTEEPSVPTISENVELKVQPTYPADEVDTQMHAGGLEVGSGSVSLRNEDIFLGVDMIISRQETEKQQEMNADETNEDIISPDEDDSTILEELNKPTIEEFVDDLLHGDATEMLEPMAEESDREEGELMIDESDLQLRDDMVGHQDQSDVARIGNQVGDTIETVDLDASTEAKVNADAGEMVSESHDKLKGSSSDQGALEREPSPQPASLAREPSPQPASLAREPSPQPASLALEPSPHPVSSPLAREPSPQPASSSVAREGSPINPQNVADADRPGNSQAAEAVEPRVRTITISERAKQNAALRQNRIAQIAKDRGGRSSSTPPNTRSRGGRGGR